MLIKHIITKLGSFNQDVDVPTDMVDKFLSLVKTRDEIEICRASARSHLDICKECCMPDIACNTLRSIRVSWHTLTSDEKIHSCSSCMLLTTEGNKR